MSDSLGRVFPNPPSATPIDMEGLASDVGTGVRGEKDHGAGEVLRDLDPAERDVFFELEKARPAALFVRLVTRFKSTITIRKGGESFWRRACWKCLLHFGGIGVDKQLRER
jgi:hypothetical protein